MTTDIETVHLIFKTHLDVGFTALANNVVERYFEHFIPSAINVSEHFRATGQTERFVWTTGSWLIYEYLENAATQERQRLEIAIEAGDITWHGLPFTMHSELMDASLFRYGLSLSQALDRRFGKQTIAAKMTDVPGHTRAIVPLLAEFGIKFLHIGVNMASTPPDVPAIFVWKDRSEADVVVMYHDNYGGLMAAPGTSTALALAHARDEHGEQDNLGPHTAQQVVDIFRKTKERFPKATVIASTLDAFARELLHVKDELPVISAEIGDTWIHGVGTDPLKVSQYRELCRLRNEWLDDRRISSDGQAFGTFSRRLLMIPEHTWGLDEKTHLTDYVNYSRDKFDVTREGIEFKRFEASWTEQRSYVDQAIRALGDPRLVDEAYHRLKRIKPIAPNTHGFEKAPDIATRFDTTHFTIGFDPDCGAISHLMAKESQQVWCTRDHLLALVRYQTYSQMDYDRFLNQYLIRRPEWAIPDFSKPGLADSDAESRWWLPSLTQLLMRADETGHYFIVDLLMPSEATVKYGCPKTFTLEIHLPAKKPVIDINLQWFQKPASRLPEAIWFSFCPRVNSSDGWRIDKLGQQFSPLDVIRDGNRHLHAVDKGLYYHDRERELCIETLDAPLVAPGEPSLLNYNNDQPPLVNGMHFNLYNNVWGTNFPMWYEDDARFRFRVRAIAHS